MNAMWAGPQRPVWLDASIAFAVGLVAQAIIRIGFAESDPAAAFEPLTALLLPAAAGALAGLLTQRGSAVVGLIVGVIGGAQVASLVGSAPAQEVVSVALSAGAAALGFLTVVGARAGSMPQGFRPPSPLDRERVTMELTSQLRSIDPNAPGAFERSITLLRQVNEQLGMYGPWSPWNAGEQDPGARRTPADLLQIQAELVEAARTSAMAAGARRVTITSTGMGGGLDVQAIFGDPIVGEPVQAQHEGLHPID